jgi:hypothetical protein
MVMASRVFASQASSTPGRPDDGTIGRRFGAAVAMGKANHESRNRLMCLWTVAAAAAGALGLGHDGGVSPGGPVDCPPGAIEEGEACGDDTNGGCNSNPPAFPPAVVCDDTICGTAWAADNVRDTDWYLVSNPGGVINATLVSDFPGVCFIVAGVGRGGVPCAPMVVGEIGCSDDGANIAVASASVTDGVVVVFVAPGDCSGGGIFDGVPCGGANGYVLTINDCLTACQYDYECPVGQICPAGVCVEPPVGACCQCDGADQFCTIEYVLDCAALGGEYLGDGESCAPPGEQVILGSHPNVVIPDNDAAGVSDTLIMDQSFIVVDLDVGLTIDHTWIGDLCVTLTHGLTTIELIRRPALEPGTCGPGSCCGCSTDNYAGVILNDEGPGGPIEAQCATGLSSPPDYTPNQALSAFDGMDAAGAWTITVSDGYEGDVGVLVAWSLTFTALGSGSTPCADTLPDQCGTAIMGFLDIEPGSCPNPLNPHGNGVLSVALVGARDIDPMDVVPSSLLLSRADGLGGSVAPHGGPLGPHTVLEDVASPFAGVPCDCHELGPDGVRDLLMKFRSREVVHALDLGDLPAGALVELVLTGSLVGGTRFTASDCVWLVPVIEQQPHPAGAVGR